MKEEKTLYKATLVFLVKHGAVLLARKMKKIGEGCLNGYGGGIEGDETIEECAAREFQEESGGAKVWAEDLKKVAVATFYNQKSDGTVFSCDVHVFTCDTWQGEPSSTEEMFNPKWYPISRLGKEILMPADYIWLPPALSGKKLLVKAWYGPFQKTLLREVEIKEVENFEGD